MDRALVVRHGLTMIQSSIACTAGALFLTTLSLFAEAPKHSAISPEPRGQDWWKERANLINKRVKETPESKVVFIGDSITQGWEGAGKAVWEERYAAHGALNLGIGGDRTQHVLHRLLNGNLEGIAPKAAVVMIGTNNSNGYDNTAKQIAEGVGEIVQTLRSKAPQTKILLLGIFPRGENINEQRGKLLQINQILAKHDDGKQVRFLDIGHHFITEEGLIPAEIMPDYLHLSPKGYEMWADAIDLHLRELMGEGEQAMADSPFLGDWVFVIQGPDGSDVEMPLTVNFEEGEIFGTIGSSEDRNFPIENAKIEGDSISFTATRDRPDGGSMTYSIKGALEEGTLSGTVSATMDGNEIEQAWKASRSK
jgi:lysophospholipase L1-like esterase